MILVSPNTFNGYPNWPLGHVFSMYVRIDYLDAAQHICDSFPYALLTRCAMSFVSNVSWRSVTRELCTLRVYRTAGCVNPMEVAPGAALRPLVAVCQPV